MKLNGKTVVLHKVLRLAAEDTSRLKPGNCHCCLTTRTALTKLYGDNDYEDWHAIVKKFLNSLEGLPGGLTNYGNTFNEFCELHQPFPLHYVDTVASKEARINYLLFAAAVAKDEGL